MKPRFRKASGFHRLRPSKITGCLSKDFIFSKSYVKRFIARAAAIEFSNAITNKVNFDIEFSDKGIVLGNVNLLEQKGN